MSVAINGTDGITFNDGSLQPSAPVGRNLIINGNMMIDQRNTTQTGNGYSVDRWAIYDNTSATYTLAQDSSAPSGFVNSLKFTTTGTDTSIGSTEQCVIYHQIEGYNITYLNWGTANAKTVTLSFYVRSSLTGTFAGSLGNNGYARSYPFTYTISSADTWEQKTITITGDTTGTWLTTNGVGISLRLAIAAGSSFEATAGAWDSGNYFSVSGATNVVGTASSTFYITGVQLEVGEGASNFENLPYDVQLQRCQRYYEKSCAYATVPNNGVYDVEYLALSNYIDNLNCKWQASFKVEKRATPTLTLYGGATGKWQTAKLDGSWGTLLGSSYAVSLTTKYVTVNNSDWNGSSSWQTITAGTGRMTRGVWVVECEL